MGSLGMTRRRLVALVKAIATQAGEPDLIAVPSLRAAAERRDELRAILADSGHDFSFLLARLDADPDCACLSRKKRIAALIDYARVAIGLVDRALWPRRGRVIVGANDD